jgi:3-hydroxyisobutyrate dehydrogenase
VDCNGNFDRIRRWHRLFKSFDREDLAMTIGYIGLGNMGGPLARRIQLQHQLLVYDPSAAAVQRMVEKGSTPCASAAELASRCDVIMLCLPTSDQVRSVLFGENGIASVVKAGTLIVDQTTGDPNATRAMAAELAGRGVELIDAPVSGGAGGADAGTIAIMVGASSEQYARIHPILAVISPNIFHAGDVGAGHVIKLVNNMLSGTTRLVTFEGMALAAKNGIDPRKAFEIIMAGGGRNSFLERFVGPRIINGDLGSGFTLGLIHKDVRLACQLGVDSGVPMYFGNLAREFYQMCMSEMGKDAQVNTAALVVDRIAGTHVVPPVGEGRE